MNPLLNVENLSVSFYTYRGEVQAVRDVSFSLYPKETLAIVGESGCGKTVTAKSILRLHERSSGVVKEGSTVEFDGDNILEFDKKRLRSLRGNDISMIFQDSMTSLNPTMTVGKQITECILEHKSISKAEALKETKNLLSLVEINNVDERIKQYPHQLSGGMRQRVMIAMALSCDPKILIADEPTTALDVTIQAQLLDLLESLKSRLDMSIILVTHDLGVVASFADKIQVMYAGKIVERGKTEEIFSNARHPYTWALLQSIPSSAMESKSELYSITGSPPDLISPPIGCPFAPRCDYCMPICKKNQPAEHSATDSHSSSCWLNHEKAPKIKSYVGRRGNYEQ